MDGWRIDRLVRHFETAQSRRAALGSIIVAALLGITADPTSDEGVAGKRRRRGSGAKGNGRAHDKHRGSGRVQRQGRNERKPNRGGASGADRQRKRGTGRGKKRRGGAAVQAAGVCYPGTNCMPGPSRYLARCDFGNSSTLSGATCTS